MISISRRWFHPNTAGPDAERLLLQGGFNGSFLVRPSANSPGNYTISVRKCDKVFHFSIQNNGDCYSLFDTDSFASLAELINYYTVEKGKLESPDGEITDLLYPLFSTDPSTERWYHGCIDRHRAETLLLEKGERNSFLVRESITEPGNFAFSVKVSNTDITHVKIAFMNEKYSIPGRGSPPQFDTLTDLVEYYQENHLIDTNTRPYYLLQPVNSTLIHASAIGDRVETLEKSSEGSARNGFVEEFEHLQQQEIQNITFPRKEGAKPENKAKNRYKNILPFDHTRVVLKDGNPDIPGSDYLNASFLMFDQLEDRYAQYIATQGCLQNTIADFWRMVWQENSCIIVCLTKLLERGKNKCYRYWAEKEEVKEHYVYMGKLVVTWRSAQSTTDFEIKELILELFEEKDGMMISIGTKTVFLFHFMTWPDKSIPEDPGPLLDFIHRVNDHRQFLPSCGPLLVHCSAGIGRTGAFVVLDYVLNNIRKLGLSCDIDIHDTVLKARTQRSGMVQTSAQYKFIYQAVRHYIETTQRRLVVPTSSREPNETEYGNLYGNPGFRRLQ